MFGFYFVSFAFFSLSFRFIWRKLRSDQSVVEACHYFAVTCVQFKMHVMWRSGIHLQQFHHMNKSAISRIERAVKMLRFSFYVHSLLVSVTLNKNFKRVAATWSNQFNSRLCWKSLREVRGQNQWNANFFNDEICGADNLVVADHFSIFFLFIFLFKIVQVPFCQVCEGSCHKWLSILHYHLLFHFL